MPFRLGVMAVTLLWLTGCSLGESETSPPPPPQLASGRLVPDRCAPQTPPASATVSFVAKGTAWALDPRSGKLTCLFPARRPGPFLWGPRGDRALLARLEVKSFGDAPSRPPTAAAPGAMSWGRPIGKSIVFVGRSGRALLKAHPAGGGFSDVTPVSGATYERVAYHPSGLAFAFVLRLQGHEALWISSNVGKKARELVHGRFHTDFEALAFRPDGWALYFAAQHATGRVDVHALELTGVREVPVVWRGGPNEHVSEITANYQADVAFTVGRSCATRRAVVVTAAHPDGTDALPGITPSRTVGWIDDRHLLVAGGSCGDRLDLYSVALPSLTSRLLVKNVAAAAVRRPERTPTPELPLAALEGGSGAA